MAAHALVLLLARQLGVVVEAVEHSAAHHCAGIDKAVGLGHQPAIQGARLVAERGPVVFGRIGYQLDLVGREPAAQPAVGAHNVRAFGVVRLAPGAQPCVVIGCGCQCHGLVGLGIVAGQLQALAHHAVRVVAAVAGIEVVVQRHYLVFKKQFYLVKFAFAMHCAHLSS